MTAATAELTVYQSKRDPEWAALVRRFWRVRPQVAECQQCGAVFRVQPANRSVALYCDSVCRRRAAYERELARKDAA